MRCPMSDQSLKIFIVKRKHCVINHLMVTAKDKQEAEAIIRMGEWDRQIGVIQTETYLTWETEKDVPDGELNQKNKSVDAFE